MKSFPHVFLGILLAFLAASCSKNDDLQPDEGLPELDLLPLAIGNSWTYEFHLEKSDGSWSLINLEEELITGDTLIGGQVFFILEGKEFGTPFVRYLRQDGGDVVNHDGVIWLSNAVFDEILRRDTFTIGPPNAREPIMAFDYAMKKSPNPVEVPAGLFEVYDFTAEGIDLVEDPPEGEIVNHNYYANGVGKIKHTTHFYTSRNRVERRLLNFSIE